ncbi:DDE-type integrase/transposase/recombinase [Moritella viscosa]|uniref:Putative transposase n=1 Tax=Moritella viscosa TaxID=80854 RepID=A0A1L0CC24_9GAMM|nr:DDE-type integrase/transposase/recombinase [Moritella viscosa]SGZ18717.1 Putative transposase [Moritella viscosa]SHO15052.1 Putative transposase [Moritella viscosa]SHO15678.1 Putative transposase [Moritella viscosa]SHO18072.1 Putative transposase [Moritella viscosa]SHO19105.1 Putative transposase [Moritella viscosa]
MWQVNETLSYEGKNYRILYLSNSYFYWLIIDDDKGLPERVYQEECIRWVDEGKIDRVSDPYAYLQAELCDKDSITYLDCQKHYEIIKPIVQDEGAFDKKTRASRINQAIVQSNKGKSTIYRLLRRYWQRGQIKNAFLPDYKNSGAAGKRRNFTTNKAGRSRLYGVGEGVPVTEGIRKQFRIICDKYLMNDNGYSIRYAYSKFGSSYKTKNPNVGEHEIPTFRQFQYFYTTEYPKLNQLIARTPQGEYNKDVRPLHGTATEQALGPGSRYEIDATIADIYLVDDYDADKVIGRPTIYMVIDVFSRMVAGFYIGFDNPSFPVAMKALISSFSSKSESCERCGIKISDKQWPCIGIPDVVLADRGELMSHQANYLVDAIGVRLESAPPRRGDAKGIVERSFGTLQAKFKPYMPGVVTGNKVKKHGEKDYRVEAAVTKSDFVEILLYSILAHNLNKPLEKYDRAADMPDSLPPVPIQLWRWGLQNRTGRLRSIDIDIAKILLLPREKITISELGVKLWGLTYTGKEVIQAGWMHRSSEISRPKKLYAAYDLGSVNYIYLFPERGKNTFWICDISSRSREFNNMTWYQVWERQSSQKQTLAETKYLYSPVERDFNDLLEKKVKNAQKNRKSSLLSDAQKVREIKENKRKEREKERSDLAIKPNRTKNEEPAEVIQLKGQEENYQFPDFIPELFDDKDENE